MKKLAFFLLVLSSCVSKKSIEINETECNLDIKVLTYNKDSLNVFFPLCYKITNNSNDEVKLDNFLTTECEICQHPLGFNQDYENLKIGNSYERSTIPSKSSKEFFFFISKVVPNTSIDSSYWFNKEFKFLYNESKKLSKSQINFKTKPQFMMLKKMYENDSISFIFKYDDDYILIKSAKLFENKFITITSDDIKLDVNKVDQSVFQPK